MSTEKKDGSVIITATWDGKGFKYTSHYPPKAINEDTIQSKGVGDIQELLAEVLQYFYKDTTNVPQDLYKEVFNFLYPPTTPTSNADTKGEVVTDNGNVACFSVNDLLEIDHSGNGKILTITYEKLMGKLKQKLNH
jgi:hypothetical protein